MTHRSLAFALVATLAASAFSLDADQALQIGRSFLVAGEPGMTQAELDHLRVRSRDSVQSMYRWEVMATQHGQSVFLDDATGEVTMYGRANLYERAMGGPASRSVSAKGKPFYASEPELVAGARAKLDKLDWRPGPDASHRPLPKPDPNGEIPRSLITITFSEHPNGYQAYGVGNFCLITLDSLSGETVEIQRQIGFSYQTPNVRISAADALAIAQEHGFGDGVTIDGPRYQQMPPLSTGLGERAKGYVRDKFLPLVYWAHGGGPEGFIAADDGEVLWVSKRQSGLATHPPQPAPSAALDPALWGVGALAALGGGLLLFTWARAKRS